MPYIKPPMLTGDEQQQIKAIRDYLFQLAGSLEAAERAQAEQTAEIVTLPDGSKVQRGETGAAALAEVKKSASELRALIVKTAEDVTLYADKKVEEYDSRYVARSDFGTYAESVQAQISTTARGVEETYQFAAAVQGAANSALASISTINGQIRRGLIEDPGTHETVLGIAIAENLQFTGTEQTVNGQIYYELSPGQTFGLYTATGWQFWINGAKVGWFSAVDGMLHVANVAVENELRIGGNWVVTTTGGFGLRVM